MIVIFCNSQFEHIWGNTSAKTIDETRMSDLHSEAEQIEKVCRDWGLFDSLRWIGGKGWELVTIKEGAPNKEHYYFKRQEVK